MVGEPDSKLGNLLRKMSEEVTEQGCKDKGEECKHHAAISGDVLDDRLPKEAWGVHMDTFKKRGAGSAGRLQGGSQ